VSATHQNLPPSLQTANIQLTEQHTVIKANQGATTRISKPFLVQVLDTGTHWNGPLSIINHRHDCRRDQKCSFSFSFGCQLGALRALEKEKILSSSLSQTQGGETTRLLCSNS
jgi:hypothetical protein